MTPNDAVRQKFNPIELPDTPLPTIFPSMKLATATIALSLLACITSRNASAQVNSVDFRFSPLVADESTPITSESTFLQGQGSTFYEDNTPQGNARFSYISGEGLAFDNDGASAEFSQTALYFDFGFPPLDSAEDFETRVVMELPTVYSDLSPNRFVAIDSSLFYGPPNNEYDNELVISLTEASFASLGFDERFFFFETEDVDGPPEDFEPTNTQFVEVIWDYSATTQSIQITVTEMSLVEGNLVAGDFHERTVSVPGANWFVPAVGFESEGGQQVPPNGVDPASANKPRVHGIQITRGDGQPPFETFEDSDGDGVADVLEERFGGNPFDPTDGRATIEYLTNNDLVSADSILEARPGKLTIRKRADGQFELPVNVDRSNDLGNWIPFINEAITIPSPSQAVEFLRLRFE